MNLHRNLAGFVAALAASAAMAQAPRAQGPAMGFVIDARTNRIHPVIGVPGAAVVGAAVDTPSEATARAVSPTGAYVLAWSDADRLPALWLPSSGVHPLEGLMPGADRVALSPAGTAAAFYYARDNRLVVVSGLPDHPSSPAEINQVPLAVAPETWAVSDDGELLLCASSAGQTGAVVVLGPAGERNRLTLSGPVTALAFAPRTHDALAASGTDVVLIRDAGRPTGWVPLPDTGVGPVSAIAGSVEAGKVMLASAESGKIAVLSLDWSQPPALLDCHCKPEGFFQMNEDAVYRLSGYAGGTVHILDITAAPRILALPPAVEPDKEP
jgi:WD40 repeat protein